jgi:hypothetical protein
VTVNPSSGQSERQSKQVAGKSTSPEGTLVRTCVIKREHGENRGSGAENISAQRRKRFVIEKR